MTLQCFLSNSSFRLTMFLRFSLNRTSFLVQSYSLGYFSWIFISTDLSLFNRYSFFSVSLSLQSQQFIKGIWFLGLVQMLLLQNLTKEELDFAMLFNYLDNCWLKDGVFCKLLGDELLTRLIMLGLLYVCSLISGRISRFTCYYIDLFFSWSLHRLFFLAIYLCRQLSIFFSPSMIFSVSNITSFSQNFMNFMKLLATTMLYLFFHLLTASYRFRNSSFPIWQSTILYPFYRVLTKLMLPYSRQQAYLELFFSQQRRSRMSSLCMLIFCRYTLRRSFFCLSMLHLKQILSVRTSVYKGIMTSQNYYIYGFSSYISLLLDSPLNQLFLSLNMSLLTRSSHQKQSYARFHLLFSLLATLFLPSYSAIDLWLCSCV